MRSIILVFHHFPQLFIFINFPDVEYAVLVKVFIGCSSGSEGRFTGRYNLKALGFLRLIPFHLEPNVFKVVGVFHEFEVMGFL